jgi:excisionase family DNA binding protein
MKKSFTIAQVAEQLGVSTRTVRRWIQAGDLVVHRLSAAVRIAESDLNAFLAVRRAIWRASRPLFVNPNRLDLLIVTRSLDQLYFKRMSLQGLQLLVYLHDFECGQHVWWSQDTRRRRPSDRLPLGNKFALGGCMGQSSPHR